MRKKYSRVYIHYTGSRADGTIIDDNCGREPLCVTLGSSSIPAGIEKALYEMECGEERTLHLSGEDGYGDYREEGILQVPLREIPDGDKLPVGQYVEWRYKKAPGPTYAKVLDVSPMFATLDLNHPLAGQQLTYWVRIESEDREPHLPDALLQLLEKV